MYVAVWEFLLMWAPQLRANLRVVVSDFEKAILTATRRVFPQVQMRGCWFHFTRVSSLFNSYRHTSIFINLLAYTYISYN